MDIGFPDLAFWSGLLPARACIDNRYGRGLKAFKHCANQALRVRAGQLLYGSRAMQIRQLGQGSSNRDRALILV